MLRALDVVSYEVYSDRTSPSTPSPPSGQVQFVNGDSDGVDSDLGMDSLSRVRMVHFQKNTDEAMVSHKLFGQMVDFGMDSLVRYLTWV